MKLEVNNVIVLHGYAQALDGVSIEVSTGTLSVILGSNGAGKSTLLRTIMGFNKPKSGTVCLNGMDITHRKVTDIVRLGVSLVPEGRQIFPDQSVLDNLLLGSYHRSGRLERKVVQRDVDELMERFTILSESRNRLASTLSGGEQQILAICRGLMSKPRFLLLDEPSIGLDPQNVSILLKIVIGLTDLGIGILLSEQMVEKALDIANWGYILKTGKIVLQGSGDSLLGKLDLIKGSFLGMSLGV